MTGRVGKPTAYKGVNFRSRLEARWAAMGAPFMIVNDVSRASISFNTQAIGHLYDHRDGDDDNALLFAPGKKRHGLEYDFAGEFGSWSGWLTGAYDGNALFEATLLDSAEVFSLWSRAGNAIQWKPKSP
ncbi:hypothetical protein [Sphingopyxis terrae]|uniref:hypothetical protein n=1 Tax=Sphingopyxis terrae TaxID=33052 RepID=UPI0007885191|nr:hypothetical protein [Sphingopyxis terrae]